MESKDSTQEWYCEECPRMCTMREAFGDLPYPTCEHAKTKKRQRVDLRYEFILQQMEATLIYHRDHGGINVDEHALLKEVQEVMNG